MKMFQVVADGQVWTDSDGQREFDQPGAIALADSLQRIGYDTSLIDVDSDESDEWDDWFDVDGDIRFAPERDEFDTSDPYDKEYDVP